MVQQSIENYIDHLDDRSYLIATLTATTIDQLNATMVDLLRSPDHDIVGRVTLFLRDSVLYLPGAAFCVAFRDSPIVSVLEDLLLANNWWIRRHAVYTLGKTGCVRSLPALRQAFQTARDRDPLLLPELVFEIRWLDCPHSWTDVDRVLVPLIDHMLASATYTARWGAIDVLSQWDHGDPALKDQVYQVKLDRYERLRHDPNPLIRSEADYHYRLLLAEPIGRTLPKPERRQQRKLIDQFKPTFTYSSVAISFTQHLSQNRLNSYTVADLEHFIEAMVQNELGHN